MSLPATNNIKKRPRVALIADSHGWAFTNIANYIEEYLSDEFSFTIYHIEDYKNTPELIFDLNNYDLVHFFFRDHLYDLLNPYQLSYFQNSSEYRDFLVEKLGNLSLSISVHDHLFLDEDKIKEYEGLFNLLVYGYAVSSQRLYEIYKGITSFPSPAMVIEDGIDLDIFKPNNLSRLSEANREIVVGWAGNSQWGMNIDNKDHKGLLTIIKVAVEELKNEGFPIRGEYVDRNTNPKVREEMLDYYNSIDIYVCASDTEGTPNPVLEATACGVPIISTDVGIIPELFGPKQVEFIIERSVEDLKDKLRALILHPELRQELSNENLKSVQEWNVQIKMERWRKFFRSILHLSQITMPDQIDDVTKRIWPNIRKLYLAEVAAKNIILQERDYYILQRDEILNSRSYRAIVNFRNTKVGQVCFAFARWVIKVLHLSDRPY